MHSGQNLQGVEAETVLVGAENEEHLTSNSVGFWNQPHNCIQIYINVYSWSYITDARLRCNSCYQNGIYIWEVRVFTSLIISASKMSITPACPPHTVWCQPLAPVLSQPNSCHELPLIHTPCCPCTVATTKLNLHMHQALSQYGSWVSLNPNSMP